MPRRLLSAWIIISFLSTLIIPAPKAHADDLPGLPVPGTLVNLSPAYEPVLIKGLKVHPENPFLFDFIIDTGDDLSLRGTSLSTNQSLKEQSIKLIKYFLASLTIPEKDLWVNLSPYEKNRMIAPNLGQTTMGRDMLAQDYILKQLTASLIYPEKHLGKAFWDEVYAKALEMYGTTQVPVNTFNKVWIVADKADVFERGHVAYVVGAHLKVMLEEDYLALTRHAERNEESHSIASNIIRQIILPQIEKEVNTGKNFVPLRQMFYSMILASWYKMALKDAILTQIYGNQSKVEVGINQTDPKTNEEIFQRYLKAYKKGVFNYIKEEISPGPENKKEGLLPRKYFSGGENLAMLTHLVHREATLPQGISLPKNVFIITVTASAQRLNAAMTNTQESDPLDMTVEEFLSVYKDDITYPKLLSLLRSLSWQHPDDTIRSILNNSQNLELKSGSRLRIKYYGWGKKAREALQETVDRIRENQGQKITAEIDESGRSQSPKARSPILAALNILHSTSGSEQLVLASQIVNYLMFNGITTIDELVNKSSEDLRSAKFKLTWNEIQHIRERLFLLNTANFRFLKDDAPSPNDILIHPITSFAVSKVRYWLVVKNYGSKRYLLELMIASGANTTMTKKNVASSPYERLAETPFITDDETSPRVFANLKKRAKDLKDNLKQALKKENKALETKMVLLDQLHQIHGILVAANPAMIAPPTLQPTLSPIALAFVDSFDALRGNRIEILSTALRWAADTRLTWQDLKNVLNCTNPRYNLARQGAAILLRTDARKEFIHSSREVYQEVWDTLVQHTLSKEREGVEENAQDAGGIEYSPGVRSSSLKTLYLLNAQRAKNDLLIAMSPEYEPSPHVRKEVVEILRLRINGEYPFKGDPQVLSALQQAGHDPADSIAQAAKETLTALDHAQVSPGGIDLTRTREQMNVHKEAQGVQMQFDPAMIARIRREGFDGLDFKIERIVPVTNLPLLLGLTVGET